MARITGYMPGGSGYSSYADKYVIVLDYWEETPSDYITGNYTKVRAKGWIYAENTNYSYHGYTTYATITCDGQTASDKADGTKIGGSNNDVTLIDTTFNVSHNSDGSKQVHIELSVSTNYPKLGSKTIGTYFTLTTIPRASSVSVSSNPTLGGNAVTITCSRASSSFTHTLRVINPDNTSQAIETFTGVGESYSWIPPLISNNSYPYASHISGESRTFTIECETFNGGTSLGKKTCTTTIFVPKNANTRPTMDGGTFNYTDANTICSNWGVLVQSKSRLDFNVVPICKANSSPGSAQVNIDSSTYNGIVNNGVIIVSMTKTLQTSGNNVIKVNASDSRGFSIVDSNDINDWITMATINVIPYITPSFTIQPSVSRCKIVNNQPVLDDLGSYASLTFKARISAVSTNASTHKNSSALLKISWKLKSASWSDTNSVTINGVYNSNSDDYVFEKTNWILTKSSTPVEIGQSNEIDIKFELTDAFNTSSNPIVVYKSIGVGADLLNFNSNGKAIGIGQLSTATGNDAKLEIGIPTYIKGNLFLNGIPVGTIETLPIGSIIAYPSPSNKIPDGWKICDGSVLSRTTYSDLFDLIGTTYGTGDGSTTFNIPNIRGKTIVGLNANETEFEYLNKQAGSKYHTLSINEMPSHAHYTSNYNGGGKTQNNATTNAGVHGDQNYWNFYNAGLSNYVGGNAAHNNLQPYITLYYIIKVTKTTPLVGVVKDDLNGSSSSDAPSVRAVKEAINNGIIVAIQDNLSGNSTDKAPSIRAVKERLSPPRMTVSLTGNDSAVTFTVSSDYGESAVMGFNNKRVGINDTENFEISSGKCYIRNSNIKAVKISAQTMISRGPSNSYLSLYLYKNDSTIQAVARQDYDADWEGVTLNIQPIIFDNIQLNDNFFFKLGSSKASTNIQTSYSTKGCYYTIEVVDWYD